MSETRPAILGILEGILWHRDPLRLSDSMQLRSPTSKERFFIEDFLKSNHKSGRLLDMDPLDRDSCILESALPASGVQWVQQSDKNFAETIEQYLARPLTLLRLFRDGALGIRHLLLPVSSTQDKYVIRQTDSLRPAKREFGRGNYELDLGEAEQLQEWLRLNWVHDLAQRPEVRWFNKAYQEPNSFDQVHHIVTALEYILFRDDTDRANLRYKFPMRGAWLLGENYENRRDIFRDLRRAHDLRGVILHGTKAGSFDRGEQKLLSRVEEYLRRLIALSLSGRGPTGEGTLDERVLAGVGPRERLPMLPPLETADSRENPPHRREERHRPSGRNRPPRRRNR